MIVYIQADRVEIFKNDFSFGTFDYFRTTIDKTKYLSIDYSSQPGTLRLEQGPIRIDNEQLHIAGGFDDRGGAQLLERLK